MACTLTVSKTPAASHHPRASQSYIDTSQDFLGANLCANAVAHGQSGSSARLGRPPLQYDGKTKAVRRARGHNLSTPPTDALNSPSASDRQPLNVNSTRDADQRRLTSSDKLPDRTERCCLDHVTLASHASSPEERQYIYVRKLLFSWCRGV